MKHTLNSFIYTEKRAKNNSHLFIFFNIHQSAQTYRKSKEINHIIHFYYRSTIDIDDKKSIIKAQTTAPDLEINGGCFSE